MYSHYRIEAAAVLLMLCGCHRPSSPAGEALAPGAMQGVIVSALTPGSGASLRSVDPRAAPLYDNQDAVIQGKRLFAQYNCSGCHSNGGGGMGPSLMDDEWIYGGRLEQIHQTLVEGRPNGMPAWGGKIPDPQMWQIAAYVRSMSLPQTLAAQHGSTPSQSPAPVPSTVDQDAGWSPMPQTTNDFTSTTTGAP
jgi:cytochrome c oxidase cbb3-type subunit III